MSKSLAQPDRFAHVTETHDVDALMDSARESLANPFTSRWGRECAEFDLMDLEARRAELGRGTR
jgi:hypothetical protein